jgi:hypothetical protein
VADDPALAPGVNAIAMTYDLALNEDVAAVMRMQMGSRTVNRMMGIPASTQDLLNKLEAVRLVCQETGCAQRYLTHDAVNAIGQVAATLTLGIALLLWMIDSLAAVLPPPWDGLLIHASLLAHFTPFATGAMYLSDAGFFITGTLLALFCAVRALARP